MSDRLNFTFMKDIIKLFPAAKAIMNGGIPWQTTIFLFGNYLVWIRMRRQDLIPSAEQEPCSGTVSIYI